jgi:hypothetical protein
MSDRTPAVRVYSDEDRRKLATILYREWSETDYAVQCSAQLSKRGKPAKERVINNHAFWPIQQEHPKLKGEDWDDYVRRLDAMFGISVPTFNKLSCYMDLISELGLVYIPYEGIARRTDEENVFECVHRVERLTPEEMEDAIQGLRLLRVS